MVSSILIYIFYFLLLLLIPFFFHKKKAGAILFVLIFTAQFNVTCLIKLGITFSFFEVALLITSILIFIEQVYKKCWSCRISNVDIVFFLFLIFSFISVCIAFCRLLFGDLQLTSEYSTIPGVRSIMSLNKPLFYLLIIPVRNYISSQLSYDIYKEKFLKYLTYSGIIPSIAVVLQYLSIGFVVVHNNPSYSENVFKVVSYIGLRPVGLSNEAAGHCYELFFCLLGLFFSYYQRIISRSTFLLLYSLFFVSVILSISRTGLLFFIAYSAYAYMKHSGVSMKGILVLIFMGSFFTLLLGNLHIGGFNLFDRLLSTTDVEADLSTIERYGLAHALVNLAIDKSMVLGVGIYNYFYYLKFYLPDYMKDLVYERGFPLPSFNFIVQLWAEFGLPIFLLFMYMVVKYIRKCKNSFINEWFLSLFLFALSFQILNFSIPFVILLYPQLKIKII